MRKWSNENKSLFFHYCFYNSISCRKYREKKRGRLLNGTVRANSVSLLSRSNSTFIRNVAALVIIAAVIGLQVRAFFLLFVLFSVIFMKGIIVFMREVTIAAAYSTIMLSRLT